MSGLKAQIAALFEAGTKAAMYQRALQEKEKQQKAAKKSVPVTDKSGGAGGSDTDLFDDEDEGGSGGPTSGTSKTMDADEEAIKQGDIGPRDIVDKLNSIRSGKSFKDDDVKAAMEEYVSSLSDTERVALLAFLKGIAQIVTGEIAGQHATEPESDPANVEMERGTGSSGTTATIKRAIKPKVVAVQTSVGDKPPSAEDTSGPMPITPKRK